MSKIKQLPPDLINKIAAGEVVERPASIVKELIENSIDAGATEIKINIEKGGKNKIEIIDNGSGIDKEDLPLTIINHATSKINTVEDLNNLLSLGFRGEAIASISSVSDFSIASRQNGNDLGNYFNPTEGKISEVGMPLGTKVTVIDLFNHIPARREFLKTDQTEYKAILDVLYPIALSNLNISFSLNHNGRQVFNLTKANNFKERIHALFPDLVDNFIELNFEDSYIKVFGIVDKPSKATKQSKFRYTIINGRSIKSNLIYGAIKQGYGSLIMPVMQPNYLLILNVDKHLVDVNVHPRKEEVRFSNERIVFSAVRSAVQNALQNSMLIATPELTKRDNIAINDTKIEQKQQIDISNSSDSSTSKFSNKNTEDIFSGFDFEINKNKSDNSTLTATNKPVPDIDRQAGNLPSIENINNRKKLTFEDLFGDSPLLKENESTYDKSDHQEQKSEQKELFSNSLTNDQNIGIKDKINRVFIANNLYIITESKDGLVIYDQHALHERINFEKLIKQYDSERGRQQTQDLLIPEVLDFNELDNAVFVEYMYELEKIGFRFALDSQNDHVYKVLTVPALFVDQNIKYLLFEFINDLQEHKKDFIDDKSKTALTYLSCRSAIKAGDKITEIEAIDLINQQSKLENEYTCPHGRPLKIKLNYSELEKLFKRVV